MCHYYAHLYSCTHTHYALGKFCTAGNLLQTPCKKKNIWQTIRMGEACEDCGDLPEEKSVPVEKAKPKVVVKVGKKGRRR
jgi:hypothetical protein